MLQEDLDECLTEHELGAAVQRGAFALHYQPIRATDTFELVAYESLLRWQHPVLGMIPPSEFIPIAEQSGLIHDLGLWVLRQACRDVAALDSGFVGVNVSAVQLRRAEFSSDFARILREQNVDPHQVTVEITESVRLGYDDAELTNLETLRDLGCYLAVDDFGTGCASFDYLDKFPFNILKIDRSFTSRLGQSTKINAYVASLVELGRRRGILIVAEGVETQEQLDILRQINCPRVQGYLLGRPAPVGAWNRREPRLLAASGSGPTLPAPPPSPPYAQALLEAVIENVPAILFVKDMLAEADQTKAGRYVLLSRAGEEMLGRPRAEILGKSDHDLFPSEMAERFATNDQRALRSDLPLVLEEAAIERADGEQRQLRTRKLALSDQGTGASRYVLGISEDVTERLRYVEALHERNRQFDIAIQGMSHGLCMVDAAERMIVCNAHYLRMFSLDPEIIRPGVPFVEILRHSVENGAATQGLDELYAIRKRIIEAGQAVMYHEQLSDGRIIAISHRPMPADDEPDAVPSHGGWVSIYEDVTRQRQAEQALQEQNRRFNAALDNMGQGLCMFDAGGRLLVYNNAYLAMFGLSGEDLRVGEAYQVIVQRLVARGCYAPGTTAEAVSESMRSSVLAGEADAKPQLREMSDGRSIAASLRPMAGGGWISTFEDITERRRSEAQIAHMAGHDALTDLPNRANFQERIDQAVSFVNGGGTIAVFYIDLDGFKAVNDTFGHDAGDRYLKTVAERLRRCIRSNDVIARLGGDEFAIVQIGISAPADASRLADRLLAAASEPFEVYGRQINPRMSIGIAMAPLAGTETDQLMRSADAAMYRSKADGGHTYRFFVPLS